MISQENSTILTLKLIEQLEEMYKQQIELLAEIKQIEQLKPFNFYIRTVSPNLFVLCDASHRAVKVESKLSTLKSYLNIRGIINYTVI